MKHFMTAALLCAMTTTLGPARAQDGDKQGGKDAKVKAAWKVAEAIYKVPAGLEDFAPTATIKATGDVELKNRAGLVSKAEYPKGFKLTFTWSWESPDEKLYPDHLCVAFRTDGKQNEKRPWELSQGLLVRFNPHGEGFKGRVLVEEARNDLPLQVADTVKDVELKPGVEHRIYIEDRLDMVIVKVNGKQVMKHKLDKDAGSGSHHVLFYNREPVADAVKTTTLKKLVITALK
jgi:hypothetical protein